MDTPRRETIKLCVSPKFDSQRREHANILFLRDPRVICVNDPFKADYIVMDTRQLYSHTLQTKRYPRVTKDAKYLILNPGDLYHWMVGIRSFDEKFRHHVRRNNAKLFYFTCETRPFCITKYGPSTAKLFGGDDNIMVLPLPLGYMAGSKINVHYHDYDNSVHFWKNLGRTDKDYKYDWCWIGTDSCADRIKAVEELQVLQNGGSVFVRNEQVISDDYEESKRLAYADNKKVVYSEFKDKHLKSKVGISCNGMGMWCYKDSELLAWNVFVLRQWHKNLNICPLSPKDGKHWIVFKNENLKEKLDYYVKHDDEREEINDTGHKYFKDGILGGFAKVYVDALIAYNKTGDKKEFGDLLWKPRMDRGETE